MPAIHPTVIQGGMGVGVSGWALARAVSVEGQLGVVSGTALAVLLSRRLQLGDPGGHFRRALSHFPSTSIARRILDKHFVPGGKPPRQSFTPLPVPTVRFGRELLELTVVANFAEVFLAKEGHTGLVGINYLEKVQLPTLPSVYGAMLAGVDYVLMGAGIPHAIPGVLDAFAIGKAAELRLTVAGELSGEAVSSHFDPVDFMGGPAPALKRPIFLAIVSSATLATMLARKANGRVDGFVVEASGAGGHNAPPRGPLQLDARGEPVYGPRDRADVEKIRALGLPFWMAGSFAAPGRLAAAQRMGAVGVQVGTAFAFCRESGLEESLKSRVLAQVALGTAEVFTDPKASPTGFPFKVLQVPGTLSEPAVYQCRARRCDLSYLRTLYYRPDRSVGYRCPAEPVEQYQKKGGAGEDAAACKCLCNGLLAGIGLGQVHTQAVESPVLTAGTDVIHLGRYLKPGQSSYTAAEVIRQLLETRPEAQQPLPAMAGLQ